MTAQLQKQHTNGTSHLLNESELYDLSSNTDKRDSDLSLQQKGHVYCHADGKTVHHPSLTATIGLCHNKWDCVPREVLQNACTLGTEAHKNIELYLNGKTVHPGTHTAVDAACGLLKPVLLDGTKLWRTECVFNYTEALP